MKTILLAAGVGQRLGEHSENRPKCLLEFDGISLLRRHITILVHYGINDITIVTGYRADLINKELENVPSTSKIRFIENEKYTKGSLISMLKGLENSGNDGDFLLMDADVLYDHHIIERLLNTRHSNCFLLDKDFVPGDEPVKLCVRDNQLVEFRKKIADDLSYDYQGESVGFFRFTKSTADKLIQSANSYLARGEDNQPYEECIRDLLLENPECFGFEDITGLKWLEIDFPEDITRAKNEILPVISKLKTQ